MWDMIVSVPDHCLSFYYVAKVKQKCILNTILFSHKMLFTSYVLFFIKIAKKIRDHV